LRLVLVNPEPSRVAVAVDATVALLVVTVVAEPVVGIAEVQVIPVVGGLQEGVSLLLARVGTSAPLTSVEASVQLVTQLAALHVLKSGHLKKRNQNLHRVTSNLGYAQHHMIFASRRGGIIA
jgi:hypothetical protein